MTLPLSVLVCPDCRGSLLPGAQALTCTPCNVSFPVISGVPRLWPAKRATELESAVKDFRTPHAALRGSRLARALLPPNPCYDPSARRREARVRSLLASGLVLNLGSKSANWGEHVVNLDLVLPAEHTAEKPVVDVLADLARLPFPDASVDGIICTNVLEHVAEARACVDEMARVLKPGGVVYLTLPFMFPTHPDPLDRRRWTLEGLRHELRAFEPLESGTAAGPFSAFVALTPTLVASMFSSFYLFNAVRTVLGWLLWPLKFLDFLAQRSERSYYAAAGFYFLGRKPMT